MFHHIKSKVKEQIIAQYGSIKNFIKGNPDKNFTYVKLSLLLNPSKNCTLESLQPVLESLDMELNLIKKIRFKENIVRKAS